MPSYYFKGSHTVIRVRRNLLRGLSTDFCYFTTTYLYDYIDDDHVVYSDNTDDAAAVVVDHIYIQDYDDGCSGFCY